MTMDATLKVESYINGEFPEEAFAVVKSIENPQYKQRVCGYFMIKHPLMLGLWTTIG